MQNVTSDFISSTAQNNNNDVNGKKKEHGIKPKQSDLSLVAILQDSVLNGVQGKRLGRSYGFEVIKQNIDKTVKSLESVAGSVKATVVHCSTLRDQGSMINDIRTKDPEDASKAMVKSLKAILKDRSNLKLSSVKYHPRKTQTYKQRETVSTHLFVLNWWKIHMSLLWIMKTCISFH